MLLHKSYGEVTHVGLYLRLLDELLRGEPGGGLGGLGGLGGHDPQSAERAVRDVLAAELADTIEGAGRRVVHPPADPARDYDAFCRALRCKTEAVGRCRVFAALACGGGLGTAGEEAVDALVRAHLGLALAALEPPGEAACAATVETACDCLMALLPPPPPRRGRGRDAARPSAACPAARPVADWGAWLRLREGAAALAAAQAASGLLGGRLRHKMASLLDAVR